MALLCIMVTVVHVIKPLKDKDMHGVNVSSVLGSGAIDFATDPLRIGVCKGSPMGRLIHRSNSRKTVVRRIQSSPAHAYGYTIMG
ncbi:hypothetical protein AH6C_050 [Aeromonas phage pAh6-C]|uniref:Uncharacterized protein n=1 Tax=Aeromonas phage pAh6-C TaxID=1505227 RepID=A0A076GAH3_9CAUD|nr:hypothetical protein AH6C_050 [Aeromonas phage pAh6-C]AII26804.1 hypothetical protein AH6C_050 [Aeromonas phage pAh6-C]